MLIMKMTSPILMFKCRCCWRHCYCSRCGSVHRSCGKSVLGFTIITWVAQNFKNFGGIAHSLYDTSSPSLGTSSPSILKHGKYTSLHHWTELTQQIYHLTPAHQTIRLTDYLRLSSIRLLDQWAIRLLGYWTRLTVRSPIKPVSPRVWCIIKCNPFTQLDQLKTADAQLIWLG